jgi:hypothetical protein
MGEPERCEKVLFQNLPGMGGVSFKLVPCHCCLSLVIIHDFYLGCFVVAESENDAKLIIDPDAVLSLEIALQGPPADCPAAPPDSATSSPYSNNQAFVMLS